MESLTNKNVLITGGLGLIGSNLSRRLVGEGVNVTIFEKSLANEKSISDIKDKVEIIIGDIKDYNKIESAVKNKDYIFLLAGQTSVPISMENPFLDLELNCKATLNVLEACRKYNPNTRIIFAGTIREAGPIQGTYAKEKQYESPTSIFDLHKLTSEKYLQIYNKVHGLKTTTLRFSNVFGAGQHLTNPDISVINHFVKKALVERKLEVYGDGGPLRDYNYVENVVEALILVAQNEKTNGKFYLLGSGEGNSFKDFLDKLQTILKNEHGINLKIEKIEAPEIITKIAQGNVIVDYTKLKEDVSYVPKIAFNEGLRKTIEFYKRLI